jgi:hypothetical protein
MVKVINHRLYLSGARSSIDRGIKHYSNCLGAFLRCFKIAEKYKCEGKIYYVNSKSLKKYVDPRLQQPSLPPIQNIVEAARAPVRQPIEIENDPLPDRIQYNLPEAIREINEMPLDRFKASLQQRGGPLLTLGAYSEKVQPLYLGLNGEKRAELLCALLKRNSPHAFQKITEVWTEEEAWKAFQKFRSQPNDLLQLCFGEGKREPLIALLNGMTLEEFQKVCQNIDPATISFFLGQYEELPVQDGEAKALSYLKSLDALYKVDFSLGLLSKGLKEQWFEHLKSDAKKFFKERFNNREEQHVFVKEFLETMGGKEVQTFARLNPFDITKDDLFGKNTLFSYLISHLDCERTFRLVQGLWEIEGVDDLFRVKSLAAIYDTLKDSEKPWLYSTNLKYCLMGVLTWYFENEQWEHFVSNTVIDYLDWGGPHDQAFKAVLSFAVIFGIKTKRHFLLDPLIDKSICYSSGYQIFSQESVNSPLFVELNAEQRMELDCLIVPQPEENRWDEMVRDKFLEAIHVMKRMSPERFKQLLEKGKLRRGLGYDRGENAQLLYAQLSGEKREALLHALLQDSYYIHAIGKITEVWSEEEALKAYRKYHDHPIHLSWLSQHNGKSGPLFPLLNIMTL